MGYGIQLLLVYWDRIQAMDYSYIGMGMGYRLWDMDYRYMWSIVYGLWAMAYILYTEA